MAPAELAELAETDPSVLVANEDDMARVGVGTGVWRPQHDWLGGQTPGSDAPRGVMSSTFPAGTRR